MNKNKVYIHKINQAVPDQSYTQEFALNYQLDLICDTPKKKMLLQKIYRDTGIAKRHTVIEDYGKDPQNHTFYPKNAKLEPEPTTAERNDLYIKEADKLVIKAVDGLLKKLAPALKDKITHIITVSCTGFSAPGFDFTIMKHFALNKSVDKLHIGFMGCYGAFPAMRTALSFCRSDENAKVLVINLELCSIHYQKKFDIDTIIANAIFADGAAAYLISSDPADSEGTRISLGTFCSTYAEGSENDMAWKIGQNGFDMKLSAYVPKIINANIREVFENTLKKSGTKPEEIGLWAIHPGGKAILEKTADSLGLTKNDLRHSYDVLCDYGNMSSSTIMFVLNGMMNDNIKGKIFAAGFGPGLTIESAVMEAE